MLKKIKKVALASVAGFVLALSIGWLPGELGAVYNQYQATKYNDVTVSNLLVRDTGLYDSGGTVRLTLGAVTGFSTGNTSRGSTTVAPSTATTSGNSIGDLMYAYLSGPTAAVEGSVLIATTAVAGQGISVAVAPAVANQTSVVGVAAAAASTGSVVGVYGYGWVLARTTGTVVAGDYLVTSSNAIGYLGTSVIGSTGTVGIAFAGGVSAGGLTRIKLGR